MKAMQEKNIKNNLGQFIWSANDLCMQYKTQQVPFKLSHLW